MAGAGTQSGLRGAPDARPPHPGRSDVAEGTLIYSFINKTVARIMVEGTVLPGKEEQPPWFRLARLGPGDLIG
jgi:hypothetical protein